MFRCSRLRDAELFRDELPADAVFDEVPVYLRPEMRRGIFEPGENLKPLLAGERLQPLF